MFKTSVLKGKSESQLAATLSKAMLKLGQSPALLKESEDINKRVASGIVKNHQSYPMKTRDSGKDLDLIVRGDGSQAKTGS